MKSSEVTQDWSCLIASWETELWVGCTTKGLVDESALKTSLNSLVLCELLQAICETLCCISASQRSKCALVSVEAFHFSTTSQGSCFACILSGPLLYPSAWCTLAVLSYHSPLVLSLRNLVCVHRKTHGCICTVTSLVFCLYILLVRWCPADKYTCSSRRPDEPYFFAFW